MKTMWYAIAWSRVIGRVHVSGETEHTLHVVGGNVKGMRRPDDAQEAG